MKIVWSLTQRNLKRYFRDRGALFFSLMSVLIIVALNLFFLADMQIEHVNSHAGNMPGVNELIYAFIIGGLLCIPAVSVPLIILTFKVDDVIENVQDDLFVTPASRTAIMLGYIFAAWIAGFVITIITFIFSEIFIVIKGGELLSLASMFKVLGIMAITILAFSGFSFFLIARLKSNTALTVVNTVLNTLIGFFAGLYIPLGFLSGGIANTIKAFPLSHAAALLRRILMDSAINKIDAYAPAQVISQIRLDYGADLSIARHVFTDIQMLLFIAAFGLVFYIASALVMARSKKI